ncbi:MAG: enoyl-CoA hydratase [Acidimicrobiaceae bacterium]|nr:enoyl-CoA hydratase [Acidimicrobiaceae bacterium]MBJ31586.1 enoyl-CoA hydratase [Acidimicrobiaceae bacterium]|tara:strand:+ start:2508 stop:3218 length:711 start_codon:yes stop_codon:yes gene_type:complete
MTTGLQVQRPHDGVVVLRLNRPAERNALDTATLTKLNESIGALGEDRNARVVVIAGTGPVFCAGADLQEFAGDSPPDPADTLARVRLVIRVINGLLELEAVTISAVHGAAIGAGWGLALSCDLCWAAADTKFALPEVAKGLRLPRAISNRLIQVVGPIRAAEIILSGDSYGVSELALMGAIGRQFAEAEALEAEALAFAVQLAEHPRKSLRVATDPLRLAAARGATPEIDYQWPER